jgi:hypothetical protein
VTDHPGEQFPPAVDPDTEPGDQPGYEEAPTPAVRPGQPDYDAEPEGAHPLVEETMARLDDLRDRPVADHAEVYADLHERLQTVLVQADAESGDRV